tara:strand:+ start:37 stop:306 length:270 start_codon:yes stop_codon:yes gene_type:complete
MTRIPLYNDHLRVRDVFQLVLGWVISPYLKILIDMICLLFFKAIIIFFVIAIILEVLFPKQNKDDVVTFLITRDGKEIPWEKSELSKKN